MSRFTVHVEAFVPVWRNSLRGFCTVVIPELHLRIHDLTIHEKNASRWIGMPGKPVLERDGSVRRDERGKPQYVPVLDFADPQTRNAFGRKVIEALLIFAPAAFEMEEV